MKFALPFIAAALLLAGIVKVLVDRHPVDLPPSVVARPAATTAPIATASK